MFTKRNLFAVHSVWLAATVFLVVGNLPCRADTLVWINPNGGDWNNPVNWTNIDAPNCNDPDNCNPDIVPSINDDVLITAGGTYTVTLDTGIGIVAVNSLTLGGATGKQTLSFTGYLFQLNSDSLIDSNGVLAMQGGFTIVPGVPLTISGAMNWISGTIGSDGYLSVATNGVLTVTGGGSHEYFMPIINYGTTRIAGTSVLRANSGVYVDNQPSGLVDIQADGGISSDSPGFEWFYNYGTVRKSGGTGTSGILVIFTNAGTLDVQSGTVILSNGPVYFAPGEGGGTFRADTGATLKFDSDYVLDHGAVITGAGTNLLTNYTLTLNGASVTASNFVMASGTLAGTNSVFSGLWTWKGGQLGSRPVFTIAPNGVLRAKAGGLCDLTGVITNAGTIQLTNQTHLRCFGNLDALARGQIYNLPGALVDIQDDSWIDKFAYASEFVVNQGTVRKSGGTGYSYINPPFYNSGTLDVQSGTVGLGSVDFTGGTLNFGINSLNNYGQLDLTLAGFSLLTGTFSVNLNNGYVPVAGNSFTNIWGIVAGIFANTILPAGVAWSTNYDSDSGLFILSVQNNQPALAFANYTNGQFSWQISGPSGSDYIISTSTNLTQWTDLFTNPSANTPFQYTDTNGISFPNRFYRVRLSQ